MKKIIFVLSLMGLCAFAFSQNDEAKAFIAKAKQCEAQKKYASALGNYYDAIVADLDNAGTIFEDYQRIRNQIISGQPGFGNYNEFTLYDNWVLLLKDAEAYWTANCPYVFSFSGLKKEDVNYEKRTADYSVEVKTAYSEKYLEIVQNTLIEGLKKVCVDSWGGLKYWPEISAFTSKDGTPSQIFQKYGAALVRYPTTKGAKVDLLKNYILTFFLERMDAEEKKEWDLEWNSMSDKDREGVVAALKLKLNFGAEDWFYVGFESYYSLSCVSVPKYIVNELTTSGTGFFDRTKEKYFGFFDIKLSLIDNDGKKILTGPRAAAPAVGISDKDVNKYTFKNVPANLMEKIDGNNYRISVSEAFINYGNWDPILEDLFTRKSLNSLPDIALSTKQIINAEKSLTSVESALQEKKNLEYEKAALENDMRHSFQNVVENTKSEILYETCNKIKLRKNISIEELIQNAEKIWTEKYDASKAQYEGRKYSSNSNFDIPYPEFDNSLAAQIIENDAKGKLFAVGKNGALVLTKEGMQLLKKK